ncbi:unnamed protein product [Lampetra fluviatilis]
MRRLDQRFGTRDEEEAKSALEARRRQPGEDLRDYAEDVRELTKIACPGYTTDVIEELAAEKIQRYLSRTAWWQPDMSCPRLPFNALVERARKCERIHSERAQLRGLGRERAIASLLSEDEEEEQELARTAPDRALHTASGAGMGLLGRATLEVRIGSQACTQEFYVSSALCHECIAGTDLLERLGLNVQPRQRCATMESNGEWIPFLGREPTRPRFAPVAAILATAVTIGPLTEMLVPVATSPTDPALRPSGEVMLTPHLELAKRRPVVRAETREGDACPCFTGGRCRQAAEPKERAETKLPPPRETVVCAAGTPAEGAQGQTDHPTPTGRIQEDVGCAFPGLDDEQLRQTQQRDPDLAAVEAALREKKDALPGPWSGLYARLCVENGVVRELADAGQPECICVPAHV